MTIRKSLLMAGAALMIGAIAFVAVRGDRDTATPMLAASPAAAATPALANGPLIETAYHYGTIGPVKIFRPTAEPARFVILISGQAGWTPAATDLARKLARADATVVGVDLRHYLPAAQREAGGGLYPAGDFSELAQAAQKALSFQTYHRPILVGDGAGAALAYGTLAQSPAGIFQGGAGVDFQPRLATAKPLLAGDGDLTHKADGKGGFAYAADARLSVPFVALQHGDDASVDGFLARLPTARRIDLAQGAQDAPELIQAIAAIAPPANAIATGATETSGARLAGLPLVEVPAAGGGDTLAVFYSGDGGWAGIDRGLAQGFVKAGVPVVGYDSLRYFWTKRTPQAAADDLAAVIRHYEAAWGKKRVILAGYSFGADALPIIVQHLPPDLRAHVRTVALLGTDATGELEFHPGDWLNVNGGDTYPIAPVLTSLKDLPVVCIYGAQEHDDACPVFPAEVRKVGLPGDHHFNGDYDAVGRALDQAAGL
jgi:type IV secretory pathway VirJ component